jgi:RNA polymerase sigma-70 factor (ECF subfamily)
MAYLSFLPGSPSDQEIIDNIKKGGAARRKGEEQLFNGYSYFIKEGISKYSFTEDEAFDVYSDTILTTINTLTNGSFEGRSSIKTYIYKIYHNKSVDQLRKKTTNKYSVHQTASITDMMFNISDAAKPVIERLIDKSDWNVLKQKLAELGENCRQILLLSTEGYTDREIAESLEFKTADVVKTSRLRCMDRLRKLYKSKDNG